MKDIKVFSRKWKIHQFLVILAAWEVSFLFFFTSSKLKLSASASVSEAVSVTNDCLGIGGLVFDKVKDKLLIFAGVGNLVTHLNDIYKDDAVMQGLKELESKINQLTNKMQWQFTDLKAFIVENNFYTVRFWFIGITELHFQEIAETANTLMKYQNDVLKNPNEHSIGLFRQAAERTPPLHYAYVSSSAHSVTYSTVQLDIQFCHFQLKLTNFERVLRYNRLSK